MCGSCVNVAAAGQGRAQGAGGDVDGGAAEEADGQHCRARGAAERQAERAQDEAKGQGQARLRGQVVWEGQDERQEVSVLDKFWLYSVCCISSLSFLFYTCCIIVLHILLYMLAHSSWKARGTARSRFRRTSELKRSILAKLQPWSPAPSRAHRRLHDDHLFSNVFLDPFAHTYGEPARRTAKRSYPAYYQERGQVH